MKKYQISIFLVFLCIVGVGVFVVFRPQNLPVFRTDTVVSLSNNTFDSQGAGETSENSTKPTTNPTRKLDVSGKKEILSSLSPMSEAEEKEVLRFFEILESQEYQSFLEGQHQKWKTSYKEIGVPNFSFQEFFDFFHEQGLPAVDQDALALKGFREYFPTGEPEDYEAEMETRFQEVFLATPGSRSEAVYTALLRVSEEPDFSAWMFGRFKGEIGQQLQWIEKQASAATALGDFSFPKTIEHQEMDASAIKGDTLFSTPDTEATPSRASESSIVSLERGVSVNTLTKTLSTERISSIRKILKQYGTDEGILHLIESDPEGVDWIFENFNELDEIDAWMSEKTPQSTVVKKEKGEIHLLKPQEAPSWEEIPK